MIMFAGSSSRKEEKRRKGGARKNVERERRKCSQEITSIDFLNISVLLIKICFFLVSVSQNINCKPTFVARNFREVHKGLVTDISPCCMVGLDKLGHEHWSS